MSEDKVGELERLREYLKIPSVHPEIDYYACIKFIEKQAKSLNLEMMVYESVPKKPVAVITWKGACPELPAILLNSHMDVVPVDEEHWTHPPFEAVVTDDGWIYARGVQDMKSVGMAHLEAVRRLKSAGIVLKRTVHISFVPDEEIGSQDGMKVFSESEEYKALNVGLSLDESLPSDTDEIHVFNGERTTRQIKVTCLGSPGHGALLCGGTSGEKLHYIIDKFMNLRAEEKKKFDSGTALGDVMTINLTKVEGGVQVNVLPGSLSVSFDIRIPPHVECKNIEDMIQTWCKEAGDGVTYEDYVKNPEVKSTKTDDSALFWPVIKKTLEDMDVKFNVTTCPGSTDARFVRRQNAAAYGLSPFPLTPMLLHAHNERLHKDTYYRGISVFEKILLGVANV